MSTKELIVDFKERMVRIRHCVEEIAEPHGAEFMFREMNRECRALVPKFRRGHVLFSEVVPDGQLRLWQDFARENGRPRP